MEYGLGQEGAGLNRAPFSPDRSAGDPPDQAPAPSLLSVPADRAGLRADAYLFRELPAVSRSRIRQKIQMGESLLNGRRYSTATRLRAGDEITVTWRGVPQRGPCPDLEVLFEDAHLLAVNKPAGVPSHPVGKHQSGTVVQFARQRLDPAIRESLERGDVSFYPSLVNRLDVFTSGIVLVAKTRAMHGAMQALVERRLIGREYIALVEGWMDDDEGVIDLPLGPDPMSGVRVKMAPRSDGRKSATRYVVIERLPGHTLVRVFPLSGRQHQIRVHFAALGHPVSGDLLYKDEALFVAELGKTSVLRHCLHARRAGFTHPVTGAEVRIEAGVPADFQAIVERVRAGA
jgi:23S rRNA pseudouridine1911/1915/1917 synthase